MNFGFYLDFRNGYLFSITLGHIALVETRLNYIYTNTSLR